MGTFGTGPFGNDGALDLLDELTGQPASQRRVTLERIFFQVRDRPGLLGWKFFPDEIVAAGRPGERIAGRPARAAAHPRGRPIRPPPHEGVATTG